MHKPIHAVVSLAGAITAVALAQRDWNVGDFERQLAKMKTAVEHSK